MSEPYQLLPPFPADEPQISRGSTTGNKRAGSHEEAGPQTERNYPMTATTNLPHDHATVVEAGQCPQCRLHNIEALREAPSVFVLSFYNECRGRPFVRRRRPRPGVVAPRGR